MKATVEAAKQMARAIGARQVVVVAFDGRDGFACVSYGVTRAECQAVRPLCDRIAEDLGDGTLPAPEPAP